MGHYRVTQDKKKISSKATEETQERCQPLRKHSIPPERHERLLINGAVLGYWGYELNIRYIYIRAAEVKNSMVPHKFVQAHASVVCFHGKCLITPLTKI